MRTSVLNRVAVMGGVFVALLLPVTMIYALVAERTARRDEAAATISSEWGRPQAISGPALTVPFRYLADRTNAAPEAIEDRATFLPEALQVDATLEPSIRRVGLFGVPVYRAALRLTGRFQQPAVSRVFSGSSDVRWNEARFTLALSDPRGIAGAVQLVWNGKPHVVTAGTADSIIGPAGISAAVSDVGEREGTLPFTLTMELNGTRSLEVVPMGDETSVLIRSPWEHPGFRGAPLPYRHDIDEGGFAAEWRVPHFGRGFPAAWRMIGTSREALAGALTDSAFGVTLVQPVDIYQQTERAVKYAALFIVMTFVIAFLWEIIGGVLVHPIQYLFIGFALCLFYLLLLGLSEHAGFDVAYVSAAAATVGLIAWYWRWITGARRRAFVMLGALSALYGYLYLLLRAEDAALLAGAIGLFAMLALVMFLTRKIDWYSLRIGTDGEEHQRP